MKINVMKISYVQETFKDLSKKKIFKVLDMMSVTVKLPSATNHIMVNRNQST